MACMYGNMYVIRTYIHTNTHMRCGAGGAAAAAAGAGTGMGGLSLYADTSYST